MSFTVNTNLFSLNTLRQSNKTKFSLGKAFEQLTSGKRINRASDDSAGLAIATGQRADVRLYSQAVRNGNDGVSMARIAEGVMEQQTDALTRMRELSIQAQNGTFSDAQRAQMNEEFQAIKEEIDRSNQAAQFNGKSVFGSTTLMVGTDAETGQQDVELKEVSSDTLNIASLDISTAAGAAAATDQLAQSTDYVTEARSIAGNIETRLTVNTENLLTRKLNTEEARSKIEDADVAVASAEMTKQNILLQGQVSLLALGNLQSERALALLG